MNFIPKYFLFIPKYFLRLGGLRPNSQLHSYVLYPAYVIILPLKNAGSGKGQGQNVKTPCYYGAS